MSKKTMTREQAFLYKVKNDPVWFIENFLFIRDKSANIVPFKLNQAQKYVMKIIMDLRKAGRPVRIITLKARQMGLSTLYEALLFHDTVTNENKNSLIIAHEEAASSNLFQMSKLYYENLTDVLKPMKKYANGKVLSFENPSSDDIDKAMNPGLRSKISIATAGTGEVGRSSTVHNLHASEVAFFPDGKTTMLGLMQSVPDQPNTTVIWETTANGVGDFFHEQWKKAEKGENEFIPVFLPWFIQPEYTRNFFTDAEREQFIAEVELITKDNNGNSVGTYEKDIMVKYNLTYEQLNWRRHTVRNKCQGDEILFMQEYPCSADEAFISSGRPRFGITSLRKYSAQSRPPLKRGYLYETAKGLEFIDDPKGYISLWEVPKQGMHYAIGADVAEGLVTGDYSTAYVGNTEFDIVAQWHGHIDPDLYGKELVKLARYFNDAYLGVESNNHGLTTLKSIVNTEYWNIYYTKNFEKVSDTVSQKIGWHTNQKSKPLMINKLAEYVRDYYIGIPCELLIGEMFTYIIEDNGSTNAQQGCHDDTVMATAIMLQLLLEGKSDNYIPEIPIDQRGRESVAEIVDPAFESDNNREEWSD